MDTQYGLHSEWFGPLDGRECFSAARAIFLISSAGEGHIEASSNVFVWHVDSLCQSSFKMLAWSSDKTIIQPNWVAWRDANSDSIWYRSLSLSLSQNALQYIFISVGGIFISFMQWFKTKALLVYQMQNFPMKEQQLKFQSRQDCSRSRWLSKM